MKKIALTQGKYALVDDADFEELNQYKWHYSGGYARRNAKVVDGKREIAQMHRFILQTPDGFDTDHIDHNGLNNQRANLRVATRSQNQMNKGITKSNKSGLKGVSWHKTNKQWQAQINVRGKNIHLGIFRTKEKAYEAYCNACEEHHGEFSWVTQERLTIKEDI